MEPVAFSSVTRRVAFALRSCCLFQRRTWNMNRVLRHMWTWRAWVIAPSLKTLSGSTGTRVRKNRRLYEELLGPLKVQPAGNEDEALQFFGAMRDLHLARWNAKGEQTSLSSPRVIEFHENLIRRLWSAGLVNLLRVGTDEMPIGYLYNFVVEEKVFFMQSGFKYEPDGSRSPGMLAHALAIEHYRQRGMREYDFLAGDSTLQTFVVQRAPGFALDCSLPRSVARAGIPAGPHDVVAALRQEAAQRKDLNARNIDAANPCECAQLGFPLFGRTGCARAKAQKQGSHSYVSRYPRRRGQRRVVRLASSMF